MTQMVPWNYVSLQGLQIEKRLDFHRFLDILEVGLYLFELWNPNPQWATKVNRPKAGANLR
jgi:hypothetical protein